MEIIPGVHTIEGLGVGRAYLYQEADRLTLIDTGLAGSAAHVLAVIEGIGRKPEDLAQVVVTHHHIDHTGSLADVAERTGAQVLVHAIDAPIVRGEHPAPEMTATGFWKLISQPFSRAAKPLAAARVDRELSDGDEVDVGGAARVVHAPGHTAGSIALFLPARRLLFCGDAAAHVMGIGPPSGPFGVFNEDGVQASASFRKLAELDFDVACFGHGAPLDHDGAQLFRRAAEQL